MTARRIPVWLPDFVALAAIWGASFLFMQLGAREFGPLPTTGLRVCIGALCLLPLVWWRGDLPTLRRHWKSCFAIGLLNSAIPFACFSFALLTISTGLSAVLNATSPLFGALIAWAWLKDRPDPTRLTGLAIGFCGVAMLAWNGAHLKHGAASSEAGWAVISCLMACLCYGLSASAAKRLMVGVPSLVAATGSQLGASLALLPLTVLYWPQQAPGLRAWLAIAMLGIVCTGLAYVIYFRLITRAGPARALAVTFAIPAFAMLYGALLLGEIVTPWMLFCGAIIVTGTSLATGLVRAHRKGG